MTDYAKPQVRGHAWGETATANDLVDPGDTYVSAGWQQGLKPPRQYVNWALNYVFEGIRYVCQSGVPAWDVTETYSAGDITLGPDTYLYKSVTNNNIGNQPSDTGNMPSTNWDVPAVPTPAGSDASVRIANTGWVSAHFIRQGGAFSLLGGSINNGQVPVGAVMQWQGSLSIAGTQVSSAVAKANSLFLTSGNYAQFQYAGQSGQPTWLWGTNDGINVFVWNPANFSVNNSTQLQGALPSVGAAGGTIVQRSPTGDVLAQYLNSASPNNENPVVSQVMTTQGSDNYLRKVNLATLKAAMGTFNINDFPSANGWFKLPNGQIVQYGQAVISGTTVITFPITFPTACKSFVLTSINSTNQFTLSGTPGQANATVTNGSATICWEATGF